MLRHHGLQFMHDTDQEELTFWPCQWPLSLCLCPHLLPGRSETTLMGTTLQSLTSQRPGCSTCTMQRDFFLRVQQHDIRAKEKRWAWWNNSSQSQRQIVTLLWSHDVGHCNQYIASREADIMLCVLSTHLYLAIGCAPKPWVLAPFGT